MTVVRPVALWNAVLAMLVTVFGIVAVPAHEVLPVTTLSVIVKVPVVHGVMVTTGAAVGVTPFDAAEASDVRSGLAVFATAVKV